MLLMKNIKMIKTYLIICKGKKMYEVAFSFDKPYKQSELPFSELPEMTWLWLNTYNNSQLSEFQQEAKENDWSSTFLRENEALGYSVNTPVMPITNLENEYNEFLKLLQTSALPRHKNSYDTMKDIKVNDVEILGVVIYGTREEILEIMKEPIIKASSLGGVIDNY